MSHFPNHWHLNNCKNTGIYENRCKNYSFLPKDWKYLEICTSRAAEKLLNTYFGKLFLLSWSYVFKFSMLSNKNYKNIRKEHIGRQETIEWRYCPYFNLICILLLEAKTYLVWKPHLRQWKSDNESPVKNQQTYALSRSPYLNSFWKPLSQCQNYTTIWFILHSF